MSLGALEHLLFQLSAGFFGFGRRASGCPIVAGVPSGTERVEAVEANDPRGTGMLIVEYQSKTAGEKYKATLL